jgi:hypothetical protein
MKKYSLFIKFAAATLFFSTIYSANSATLYNITASAGLMLDDNLTRAQYQRDIYDDRAFFAGITADYTYVINTNSRAVVAATAESWAYNEANLDHQVLSIKAEYYFQPDTGYTSPWYSLSLIAGAMPYDGEDRDTSFTEAGFNIGKRLTDATTMIAGFSRYQTSADEEIFTLTTSRVFANIDFKFGTNTVYTTLAYSSGDFISTNTPPHPPSLSAYPWVDDDETFPGLSNSWTYKLDADTWSFRLGYVHALTSSQSLDANAQYYTTTGYGNNDYDGIITTLSYFYRF